MLSRSASKIGVVGARHTLYLKGKIFKKGSYANPELQNGNFSLISVRFESTKITHSNIGKLSSDEDDVFYSNIRVKVDSHYSEELVEKSTDNDLSVLDAKLEELQSKPVDFHYYLRSLHKIQKEDTLPYKFGSNQLHSSERENSPMNEILHGVVKRFGSPLNYAFGYGSKVFSQGSSVDISNSQIDMICAVSDPLEWHRQNLVQNSSDYSFLKFFGSSVINDVSTLGAGVYFNPFVNLNIGGTPLELKYGITSTDNLIDDLTNWSTMYLSGRLHKPVAVVQNNPRLLFLNQYNLANAVKLSLLLLNKKTIKESELYLTIAGLSYMGDPRLKVKGENPDKVKNIVDNQFKLFKNLYKPILDNYFPELIQLSSENGDTNDNTYIVNISEEQTAHILIELPRKFRSRFFNMFKDTYSSEFSKDVISRDIISNPSVKPMANNRENDNENFGISYNDLQNLDLSSSVDSLLSIPVHEWEYLPTGYKVKNSRFVRKLASELMKNPNTLRSALSETIETTVGSSALVQSAKGILTAGVVRSWRYALAKRRKYTQAQSKKDVKK